MIPAGGLIHLHYHDHMDVLESFTDVDGILYYKASPLFSNVQLSKKAHNHLTKENDGLFVDGTFVDRFSYDQEHDELLFDNIIVSREYPEQEIKDMVNTLWTTTPYKSITKVNTVTNDIQMDNLDISFDNKIKVVKPFTECSIKDIINIANKYYNDKVTLEEIKHTWNIGDTTTFSVNEILADDIFENNHNAGNVTMRLVDFETYDLETSINNKTKNFITLMTTDLFNDSGNKGYYISNGTYTGWENRPIRNWLNTSLKSALPTDIQENIKEIKRYVAGPGNAERNIEDTLITETIFIPKVSEVNNTDITFEYYKTHDPNASNIYWTCTPDYRNDGDRNYFINTYYYTSGGGDISPISKWASQTWARWPYNDGTAKYGLMFVFCI